MPSPPPDKQNLRRRPRLTSEICDVAPAGPIAKRSQPARLTRPHAPMPKHMRAQTSAR